MQQDHSQRDSLDLEIELLLYGFAPPSPSVLNNLVETGGYRHHCGEEGFPPKHKYWDY